VNTKYIVSGFVLVVACVLVYRTVLPQVTVDRGVGMLQGIIRFVEDSFGASNDVSSALGFERSRSDVFLYYFSQAGMIIGIILIIIGILVENGGKDLFLSVKKAIFQPQKAAQEERLLSKENEEYEKEQLAVPPVPLETQELAAKCAEGEISVVELEKMFIEGEIDWKEYSFLKGLCTK
jgi:hypothetical protein